ncbi:hypothetical protein [Methylobacterium brachythecii]|uniref:Uncharacterized protein n=1 Tax=Methylobacterium brachythecii TaxID=1176177 RepID=A0A7W6F5K5_9HYPH|nr:hypothetical protein [Methylobacterium brachythecii]MBB3901354.1 hypothetical protein [Methylobacterium brachythecii]GLS42929.1 hypothetical protein GCM10007884_09140 [Methylobacterium brachythecii]
MLGFTDDNEVERISQFAMAMERLSRRAREAGLDDVALVAVDAADSVYVLLDTLVMRPVPTIPVREI